MSDSDFETRMQGLAGLGAVTESFMPLVETCEGFRATLEQRGWSPTTAESAAGTMLLHMINHAFASVK